MKIFDTISNIIKEYPNFSEAMDWAYNLKIYYEEKLQIQITMVIYEEIGISIEL